MKLKSNSKRKLVSVIFSLALAFCAVGGLGNKTIIFSYAESVSASAGYYTNVKLTNGTGNLTVNEIAPENGIGVLAVDVESKYVTSDKENYLELSSGNDYSKTVLRSGESQYSSDMSGFYRFYVPYKSASSPVNIKIDRIGTKIAADATIKFKVSNISNIVNILKERKNGDSISMAMNDVDTFVSSDYEQKIYKAILGKDSFSIFLKPRTSAHNVRLYLGAGNNRSVSSNSKLKVKYYADESVFKKVDSGSTNDISKLKKNNEYNEYTVSLVSGFTSVNIPSATTESFIEIQGMNANNFLLNLKVESLSNISIVNPNVQPKPEEPKNELLNPTVERISKNTRYETAIELSKKAFNSSKNAIVVSGENFADALSGGALANTLKAPLLLVDNNKSNIEMVKSELSRLGVENVYVLGGEKSVALSTEKELANGRKAVRLSGADRYATSKAVYDEFVKVANSSRDAIVVNGMQFADALSAGPLSAKKGMPILLTDGKMIKSDLNRSGNIIIGGFNSMGTVFEGARINGSDRYETSTLIASKYFEGVDRAVLASGKNYPDGLASISLYNKYYAPLLLTENNSLPTSVANYLKSAKVRNVYIAGGIGSVSNSVYDAVKGL
ncbi:MAG: cell wall-binding repeat-containing protein [Peptostreptococcus porci]|nr:cell wall-binding repeat-containing protein [Peptostreptococcus porci]